MMLLRTTLFPTCWFTLSLALAACDSNFLAVEDSKPGSTSRALVSTDGRASRTTGVWYDVSYARDLYPDADCAAPGTPVVPRLAHGVVR